MKIKLLDSTLREGRQTFNHKKLFKNIYNYTSYIDKIGIKDIEFVNPFAEASSIKIYRDIVNKHKGINFYAHCYLSIENINLFLKEGSISYISTFIPFPINDVSINNLKYLLENSKNKKIRVGIENIPAYSKKELKNIFSILLNYSSIARIGILDTLGVLNPDTTLDLIKILNKFDFKNIDLEFHLHNDFGLSSANAFVVISSIKNFTNDIYFSVSLLGMGERNGILSFGDIFSIFLIKKIKNKYNFSYYIYLLKIFEMDKILFNRDPLNLNSFDHFSKSHILGELDNIKYSSINPNIFGLKDKIIFKPTTSSTIYLKIAKQINKNLINLNKDHLKKYIVKHIKENNKEYIYYEDVILLVKKYLNNML